MTGATVQNTVELLLCRERAEGDPPSYPITAYRRIDNVPGWSFLATLGMERLDGTVMVGITAHEYWDPDVQNAEVFVRSAELRLGPFAQSCDFEF